MNVKEFLVALSRKTGVSGFETGKAAYIAEEFGKYCDEVTIDKSGNLIALKKGIPPCCAPLQQPSAKIMLAAHMDEIGLMVTDIDDDGFIRFTALGGIDQRILPAKEVIVHGCREVFGVIGHKPPHLCTGVEMAKAVKMEDLVIDTGYTAKDLSDMVKVGDIASFNKLPVQLQNNRLSGKSFDNMAGVAALLTAMDNLKDYRHTADVYFVATVQEEVGKLGASTAAYAIQPDIGIAVDVYFARTPDVAEWESLEIGKGPAIAIGPNIHPRVYEKLLDCAKKNNTRYQIQVMPRPVGTDAVAIQVAGHGVATGVISIPLKYMHTSVETISIDDVTQTGKMLSNFVVGLNNCDMEAVLCY